MNKTLIVCLHGFMNGSRHDFESFRNYFYDKKIDNTILYLLKIYDPSDVKTYNYKKMYKNTKNKINNFIDEGYEVILVGYSYSTGIAAHLCQELPIKQLVLVAPAIQIISFKLLSNYIKMAFIGVKKSSTMNKEDDNNEFLTKNMVKLTLNIAKSILNERKWFKGLKNNMLILRGNKDMLALESSTIKIKKASRDCNIQEIIFKNKDHTSIVGKTSGKEYFDKILEFINEQQLEKDDSLKKEKVF